MGRKLVGAPSRPKRANATTGLPRAARASFAAAGRLRADPAAEGRDLDALRDRQSRIRAHDTAGGAAAGFGRHGLGDHPGIYAMSGTSGVPRDVRRQAHAANAVRLAHEISMRAKTGVQSRESSSPQEQFERARRGAGLTHVITGATGNRARMGATTANHPGNRVFRNGNEAHARREAQNIALQPIAPRPTPQLAPPSRRAALSHEARMYHDEARDHLDEHNAAKRSGDKREARAALNAHRMAIGERQDAMRRGGMKMLVTGATGRRAPMGGRTAAHPGNAAFAAGNRATKAPFARGMGGGGKGGRTKHDPKNGRFTHG